jgi:hypothetical protein
VITQPVSDDMDEGGNPPKEPRVFSLRRHGDIWRIVTDRPRGAEGQDANAAVSTIEQCRDAWISGDAADYFARYAEAFVPATGQSRRDWEPTRKERLRNAAQATLELSDQHIQIKGDTAIVSFKQRDSLPGSNNFVHKTLTLRRENGSWLIVAERVRPVASKEQR